MDFWILAVSSAVLLGVWKFGLSLYRGRLSVYAVILISASTALMVYALFGAVRKTLEFTTEDLTAGLVGGSLNFAGTALLLTAFGRGKVGVAAGVAALYVLVPLSYSLVRGARPTEQTAIGVALLLAGLVTFYAPGKDARNPEDRAESRAPILLALGAALFWGVAIVVLDVGSRTSVAATLTMSQVPPVALAALVLAVASGQSMKGVSGTAVAVLAGSGAALALGNIAFFTASQEGDVAIVAVLGAANPLVTALLAAAFFKERLARSDHVAFALVIIGAALVVA